MIGFILGTSEGKKILSLINNYTDEIAITTATNYGGQLLNDFKFKDLNTEPLDKQQLLNWIKRNKIKFLVDGSHPYAEIVTKNAIECCNELNVKYIRYERLGVLEKETGNHILRAKDYNEAIEIIKNIEGNILNTTGGNHVTEFINIDFNYRIIHRILPSVTVLSKILDAGIKVKDIIALQGPVSYELEKAFIKQFNIKGILTKDSGAQGGVLNKFKAARDSGVKIIVIEKPKFKYDLEFNSEEALVEFLVEECKL